MISKFNLLYEQVMGTLLKEGGHAFDGVGPILKNIILKTMLSRNIKITFINISHREKYGGKLNLFRDAKNLSLSYLMMDILFILLLRQNRETSLKKLAG